MHFEAMRAQHAGVIHACATFASGEWLWSTLDLCAHLCAAAPTARSAVITTKNAQRRNVARTRAPVALLSCLRRRGLSRSLPNLPPLLPPGESGERGLELPPLLPLLMESGERGLVMADMCVCVCVRGWACRTRRNGARPRLLSVDATRALPQHLAVEVARPSSADNGKPGRRNHG